MTAIMQFLYDLSCTRPTSTWAREVRRLAKKIRAVLSRRYDPVVKARVNEFTLSVHASNANPILYAENFYKDLPVKRIVQFIVDRKGRELGVVDIGANVGFTALIAHAIAPESDFLLIEGDPFSFELLKSNTEAIRKRTLVNVILGESNEVVEGEFLQASGTASFVKSGMVAVSERALPFNPKRIQHRKTTLDSLVGEHKMAKGVDYIKIDTDGAEPTIILGSRETLKTYKPIVFCEFNPLGMVYKGFEQNSMRLFSLFQECGFEKYCFYDQHGRLVLSADLDRDARIFHDLTNYCMSSHSVMDFVVFHRESNDFDTFGRSERIYAQKSVDEYLATYQWKG